MKKSKLITATLFAPLLTVMPLTMASCGNGTYKNPNPHENIIDEDPEIAKSLETIKRLDKDGYLYFMENTIDYYNDTWLNSIIYVAEQQLKGWTDATFNNFVDACSAYCAKDFNGNMMTGRAYDYPHTYVNEQGKTVDTGLNLMIHTPKNESKNIKYESIGTTDAFLVLSQLIEGFKNGSLDDGKTDISVACLLPWITTDGINEKGLTASILLLPLDNQFTAKEETAAKTITRPAQTEEVSIARSVRLVLDSCETVSDVETLLQKTWFNRILKNNFHLFVSDKNGESRLFEWNMASEDATEQKMTITKTNAATNFYQTFSDAQGSVPQITGLKNKYHYGYSRPNYRNTYDRFNTIVSMLDFYTKDFAAEGELNQAVMKEQTMDALLRILALYPTPAGVDSQTQYSCLFKAEDLTQKIYSFSDLSKSWTYSLKEHRFI